MAQTKTRNFQELGVSLQKILSRLFDNQELLKYIYYIDKDPLSKEDISKDEIQTKIYNKLITIIPKVKIKDLPQSVVAITVGQGNINNNNDQFINISISIEIFTPLSQWIIKDDNLRPFAIMGEIQKSLNKKSIDNLGKIHYDGFVLNFLTEEISCYKMTFNIINYD